MWFSDPSGTYLDGYYSSGGFTVAQSSATPVTIGSSDVTGVNVQMGTGYHIKGTVTGTGGTPLEGIQVEAYSSNYDGFTTTHGDGTYSVVVPAGSYTISFSDPSGTYLDGYYSSGGFTVAQSSATPVTVTTSDVTDINVVMTPAGATYQPITPVRLLDTRSGNGLTGKLVANTPRTFQITGRDGIPSNATAVTGNLTVTGSTSGWAVFLGPVATASPTSSTINFSAGQVLANGVTVALSPTGYLWATYISTTGQTTDLVFDVTGYFTPDTSGAYYHAITPARVLDTRSGIGLSGKFSANIPRTFQVTGTYVPSNAMAVTGNLTVTGSTSGWAVFLGPNSTSSPTSSTINFKTGGIVANNVTVGLSTLGTLSATYISTTGQTTDLVFDVTGYFVQGDTTGARYVPVTPARLLDTRVGNGLTAKLSANVPATFQVTGRSSIPTYATAVTGNVTVVNETYSWAVFVGPDPTASPGTSTVNFNKGDIVANGLTVALGSDGTLSATYISTSGNTTDLVFDVTGYFVSAS
jgi:serine protease